MSVLTDDLIRLAALRDAGVLTEAEFAAKKARLLSASEASAATRAQISPSRAPPRELASASFLGSTRGKVIAGLAAGAVALTALVALSFQPAQHSSAPYPPPTWSQAPAPAGAASSADANAPAQVAGAPAPASPSAPAFAGPATVPPTPAPTMNNSFLLGRWKLASGPSGCNELMAFTPDHTDQTLHGLTSGAAVSGYVVNGSSIIVGGVPGQSETFHYDVVDGNTISQPGAVGTCTWRRG
jgi:hypothetical protein